MESACTDEAPFARIVAGEVDAFDQLVTRWRDRIVDLAHLMTGDRDAAEDIGLGDLPAALPEAAGL